MWRVDYRFLTAFGIVRTGHPVRRVLNHEAHTVVFYLRQKYGEDGLVYVNITDEGNA